MRSSPTRRARRLAAALLALAVVGAGVWMALTVGNPFPPHTVMMATGPEGSAYHESAPATARSFGVRGSISG